MILELDCGNSLIKWRVLGAGATIHAMGMAENAESLLRQLESDGIRAVRMVSVRGDEETAVLADLLRRQLAVEVLVAAPAAELGGVRNGYEEIQRLGLDRWLALVAGWCRFRSAVLVIDIGTAITVDYVDATGRHLGGFIGPGLGLMRRSLLCHTSRIRYQSAETHDFVREPGSNTRDAVERGCHSMLLAFCMAQVEQARQILGEDMQVVITGGDAVLLSEVLAQAVLVPDLVFEGLALACPVHLEDECV